MNTRFCPKCRLSFGDLGRCPVEGSVLLPLPTAPPPLGTVIDGEFAIESPLATGGMSRIYRGKTARTGMPVAIKVLEPQMASHPYTVERFFREARVSRLLDHPNVVRVYWFGQTSAGHNAIVMELLGGETLGRLLEREGHLPWERAVHVIMEVCDALGHAHGRRVVHRDVKPENIQLIGEPGPGERIKLLDFGIAYVVDRTGAPVAGAGQVSGTPAYMSPEQVRGLALDGRSDLYSLGVVAYQMLTGRRPFVGKDPVSVCRQQLYERPQELKAALPEGASVPEPLRFLVGELMAKSPTSRVPGVGALIHQLMAILPEERWPSRLKESFRAAGPPRRAPRRVHPTTRSSTSEILRFSPHSTVIVLQVEILGGRARGRTNVDWPEELGRLIASWRALVEASGGLIEQPLPKTIRATFGLYQLAKGLPELREVVGHAVRLRQLLARHAPSVATRGCVMQAELLEPGVESITGQSIGYKDAALADELIKHAPSGGLVSDDDVCALLGAEAQFDHLGVVFVRGRDEPVNVFLLVDLPAEAGGEASPGTTT